MEDLIAARVYSAQPALTFSNEPIASCALRLGYNSLSHFVRQFGAIQGCPPGKYRKQYAEKHWMRPTNDGDMYAIDKSVIQRQWAKKLSATAESFFGHFYIFYSAKRI